MPYPREYIVVWHNDGPDRLNVQVPNCYVRSVHADGCALLHYDRSYWLWITRDKTHGRHGLAWEVKVAICPAIINLSTEKHILKSGETCVLNTHVIKDLQNMRRATQEEIINMLEEANA